MSGTFITSDEHYGHLRIIELANRPFTSLLEMHETIIDRHNKKVPNNPNYLTIHAGDIFWHSLNPSEAAVILSRLHGSHAFLYGNHDELMEGNQSLRMMFKWVKGENKAGGAHILNHNKRALTVNHFAQRVWQGSHKGHWHVYGHSHSTLPGLGKSFDIGVDGNDFTPWALEEIEARMETLPQPHTINNTGAGSVDVVDGNLTACRECGQIGFHKMSCDQL
jgi:calcineurin-like phosphoesterase family protein